MKNKFVIYYMDADGLRGYVGIVHQILLYWSVSQFTGEMLPKNDNVMCVCDFFKAEVCIF